MALILESFSNFLQLYSLLLIGRILLSWFPNLDWSNQPWATITQLTDPYLDLFRRFIPPLGGFDLSPMVAIIVLSVLRTAFASLAGSVV
jgi:YggT family protein